MDYPNYTNSDLIKLALAARQDMILSFDTYLDDMDNAQKETDYLNTDKMFSRVSDALNARGIEIDYPDI